MSGDSGAGGARGDRRPTIVLAAIIALVVVLAVASVATGPVARPGSGSAPSSAGSGAPTVASAPSAGRSAPTGASPPGQVPGLADRGYLATGEDLRNRAVLANQSIEPYRTAMDDLLRWAATAVSGQPHPSVSLRIKDTTGPFVDDTATAYGLALTYVITGDRRYGEASARYIGAWVDTTTTTRDTCPNDGGCQTSLVIGRTAPGFVFAADLLHGSDVFDAAAEGRLRTWLQTLILPTASQLDNNWGDAGTFLRVVLTDYLGDTVGFAAALTKWRSLMDLVAADGHIPLEVARGQAGLGYTQEALDYKVAVAVIAARRGVDLWSYVGKSGGSLKGAVDYLARYMANKSAWPWDKRVERPGPSTLWELAYAHWQDPAYVALVAERRPFGWLGHSAIRWTTLSNGVPIAG